MHKREKTRIILLACQANFYIILETIENNLYYLIFEK